MEKENPLLNKDFSALEERILAMYYRRQAKSWMKDVYLDAVTFGTGIRGHSIVNVFLDDIAQLDKATLHRELEQSNPFIKRVILTPKIKEALTQIKVLNTTRTFRTSNTNTHGSCTGRIYNPLDYYIGI